MAYGFTDCLLITEYFENNDVLYLLPYVLARILKYYTQTFSNFDNARPDREQHL